MLGVTLINIALVAALIFIQGHEPIQVGTIEATTESDNAATTVTTEGAAATTTETVPLHDWHDTGCSGSVSFTVVGTWSESNFELAQGEDASLGALCHADLPQLQEQLLENPDNPDLVEPTLESLESGETLQAFIGSYIVNGACLDLPPMTISGRPGLLCEYDNGSGNNYIRVATLVDGILVLIQGMTTADDTSAVKSAVLASSITLD